MQLESKNEAGATMPSNLVLFEADSTEKVVNKTACIWHASLA